MMLYHGTCRANWVAILADGHLLPAPHGDQHVSLTECPKVARYFADLAVEIYSDYGVSEPVVLQVDASALRDAGYTPTPFVSQVWDEEDACEWEREHAVAEPIPAGFFTVTGLPEPYWNCSSAEEQIAHNDLVAGSIPAGSTK